MQRLIAAAQNSARAFKQLAGNEKAFQLELVLFVLALPIGWFLTRSWEHYGLLLGMVIFLMIVEVLNTGIEAACNALTRDYRDDIKIAKDCGSLAVALAALLGGVVWLHALVTTLCSMAG